MKLGMNIKPLEATLLSIFLIFYH